MLVKTLINAETTSKTMIDTTEKPKPRNSRPINTNMAAATKRTSSVIDVHAALVVKTAAKKELCPSNMTDSDSSDCRSKSRSKHHKKKRAKHKKRRHKHKHSSRAYAARSTSSSESDCSSFSSDFP